MSNSSDAAGLDALGLDASLTVADLDASLRWYRDALGFAVDREFRREDRLFAVSLRAGDARILINQDTGAKGADRVKGEGFSLRLTTTQDVDGIAARVKAHGAALESEPFDAFGMRAFRVRDPDGFLFTISSPPAR
ncbi:MAG TPA: VOC family protein [Gemmatimonadaceae bacterium]|nr:VOC family protein [Gemmatimonadaceae bacterium]